MKKIVITGGLGYIGTELCKIYSGHSWNDKITVIDNRFISERVNQIRNWNMEFIQGDILDKELIKKLYNLDIKYKAIPNLYFNDLFANRYLKRYFGQSYNKFKLNTKNIILKILSLNKGNKMF